MRHPRRAARCAATGGPRNGRGLALVGAAPKLTPELAPTRWQVAPDIAAIKQSLPSYMMITALVLIGITNFCDPTGATITALGDVLGMAGVTWTDPKNMFILSSALTSDGQPTGSHSRMLNFAFESPRPMRQTDFTSSEGVCTNFGNLVLNFACAIMVQGDLPGSSAGPDRHDLWHSRGALAYKYALQIIDALE